MLKILGINSVCSKRFLNENKDDIKESTIVLTSYTQDDLIIATTKAENKKSNHYALPKETKTFIREKSID